MSIDREEQLRLLRIARTPKVKEKYVIPKKSKKKIAQEAEEKKLVSSDGDTLKEQWFRARRKEMTGTCACGCGEPSQKKDDLYFRHSAAHIFPKGLFKSVMYHPQNWVERRFWAGIQGGNACHTIMDEAGLDRWPNMEDFQYIRDKFFILAPLLTDAERALNFYRSLEKLVYANPQNGEPSNT